MRIGRCVRMNTEVPTSWRSRNEHKKRYERRCRRQKELRADEGVGANPEEPGCGSTSPWGVTRAQVSFLGSTSKESPPRSSVQLAVSPPGPGGELPRPDAATHCAA